MAKMGFIALVEAFLRLLERRQLARLEAELWKFAEALDEWLHSLLTNPDPDWRDQLDRFFAWQEAEGRIAMPEGRQSILDFLKWWAVSIGLEDAGSDLEPAPEPADVSGETSAPRAPDEPAAGEAGGGDSEPFGPLIAAFEEELRTRSLARSFDPELPPKPEWKPRVVKIERLKGFWDDYKELLASGQYEQGRWESISYGFTSALLPSSEPSIKITFDDGTILIVLGGGPESGALGGQATFFLGVRGAAAGAKTLWQATFSAFKHLGRETAETIADNVVQEVTGLPVGPSSLRRPKAAGKVKPSATAPAKAKIKLRRPRLRKATRQKIEDAAKKTPEGKFISATTEEVIEGKFHYGHIEDREHRRLVADAQRQGMTQAEFNDWVNSHPEWFQIEDPKSNLSHRHEKPGKD